MCTRNTRGPVALVGTALLTLVFSAGIAHQASAQGSRLAPGGGVPM